MFTETLASFLSLNPADSHTGLLFTESPFRSDTLQDKTTSIENYKLVYNFDDHSLQNAMAELMDETIPKLQGCFIVAAAEREHSPEKALGLAKIMFRKMITSFSNLFPSDSFKAAIAKMVAVVLLRGSRDEGTPLGDLLAIDVYGFTNPFSQNDFPRTSKRHADAADQHDSHSSSPVPAQPSAVSEVVVVLDDSDDDKASLPLKPAEPAEAAKSDSSISTERPKPPSPVASASPTNDAIKNPDGDGKPGPRRAAVGNACARLRCLWAAR